MSPTEDKLPAFRSVAVLTAATLSLLWSGVLFARSRAGFMAEIFAAGEGGGLARRLLPGAVVITLVVSLLRVSGERAGLYGWEFGVALFAAANSVIFAVLVWHGARWLNRLGAERARALRAHAESQERYGRLFEHNLAGTCLARPDGTILECNPAFARIFGFSSPEEAKSTNAATLYGDPGIGPSVFERLRREHEIKGLEIEVRRGDELVSLLVDVVADCDPAGDLIDVMSYFQDTTEQRRVELQLQRAQKMEAIGQLAGGVAHDFNNLLGVMGGYAQLLQKDLGPGHPGNRRLEAIARAVERAASLTRQLLTFSRHEPTETRICNLNQIVEGIESMLRRLIGEDVRLVAALAHDLGLVRADVGHLEQVIMNLVVNARDAMPEGGKLIIETARVDLDDAYARTHPEAHPGPHAMLAVADNGQGMDARTVARIFEPFFTTKGKERGTGLGLAMVYGLVRRYGGHVAVYSEPGHGSTFKVYLPIVNDDDVDQAEARTSQAPAPGVQGGTETILVVEDEDELRAVFCEMLRSAGYEVLEANDGDAAVVTAAKSLRPIRLLITDVVLPSGSGPSTAADLISRYPGLRVLFMSGYTTRGIWDHESLPQGSFFLQKPFAGDALLRRVRAILDQDPNFGNARS
jgi:PAS domain S-box-containing protein